MHTCKRMSRTTSSVPEKARSTLFKLYERACEAQSFSRLCLRIAGSGCLYAPTCQSPQHIHYFEPNSCFTDGLKLRSPAHLPSLPRPSPRTLLYKRKPPSANYPSSSAQVFCSIWTSPISLHWPARAQRCMLASLAVPLSCTRFASQWPTSAADYTGYSLYHPCTKNGTPHTEQWSPGSRSHLRSPARLHSHLSRSSTWRSRSCRSYAHVCAMTPCERDRDDGNSLSSGTCCSRIIERTDGSGTCLVSLGRRGSWMRATCSGVGMVVLSRAVRRKRERCC